jgi:hypothetical protein
MKSIRIGVVGYFAQKFNKDNAILFLEAVFDLIENSYGKNVTLISGATDMGVPSLAYSLAKERGWETVGITCEKAKEYKIFEGLDKIEFIGKEWGDESGYFLSSIDVLIKCGGGTQSKKEYAKAQEMGIQSIEIEI